MQRVIAPNGWPRSWNPEFVFGLNGSPSNWMDCSLRQAARQDLLVESRKHNAVKLLRQIPSIGPIRAALLVALLQTPHRFRSKRQLWAYSGFALETQDSGEYRYGRGKLRRNRERMTVRGLSDNHHHDLKNLFKSAAISASTCPGPLYDFYGALLEKGMRPAMARLTLARKIATITLTIGKKGVDFDSSTDRGAESDPARLGRVLQTSPRSNALPQTRRLDRAAHLVAPFLPAADPGLDPVAQGEAVCRVWLGEPHLSDTLARFSHPFTSVFVKAVCRKPARTV